MDLATLGVKIDPTQAQQGSAKVKEALNSIGVTADVVDKKVDRVGKNVGQSLKPIGVAADVVEKQVGKVGRNVAQHLGQMGGSATQAATRSTGAFDRMRQGVLQMATNFRGGAESILRGMLNLGQNAMAMTGTFGAMGMAITSAGSAALGATAIFGGLALAIGGLLAILALLAAAMALIAKHGNAMQVSLGKIGAATGDIKQSQAVYEALYQNSLKTGGAIDEAAGAFVRFSIAARSIGATNSQVLQLIATTERAGVVGGSTQQEIANASIQLGQALASGRLQGDELRSILENMPVLAEHLAKNLGVGIGELRKMGEEGRLTSKQVFEAILKSSDEINAKFENMPMTMGRAWAIFGTVASRTLADLDKALGLSQSLAAGIADAAKSLESYRVILAGLTKNNTLGEFLKLSVQVAVVEGWNAAWRLITDQTKVIQVGGGGGGGDFMGIKKALTEARNTFINPAYWSAFGDVLVAQGRRFGMEVMDLMDKAGDVIDAAMKVAGQALANIIAKIPGSGVQGGGTQTFSDFYQANRAGSTTALEVEQARKDVEAARARVDKLMEASRAATAAVGQNFSDMGTSFNTAKERLDAIVEEAKKTGEGLQNAQDALNNIVVAPAEDPTKWKGSGAAPMRDFEVMQGLREQIDFLKANHGAGKIGDKEFGRRRDDAVGGAIGQLSDPKAARDQYPELLDKWRAYNADKERIAKETDDRIAAGGASLTESLVTGIQRTAAAWGNLQQQIQQLGGAIVQSIGNGIGTALTDLVTGAKDAKTAFTDMAVSILKDIASMIIKLLVQLAIQAAIRAISGDTASTANAASAGTGVVQGLLAATNSISGIATAATATPTPAAAPAATYTAPTSKYSEPDLPTGSGGVSFTDPFAAEQLATGGKVRGPGGVDKVPAMLTAGEFVIKKEMVDRYGLGYLEALNNGMATTRRFATGGPVGLTTAPRSTGGGGAVNISVNVDASGGRKSSTQSNDKEEKQRAEAMAQSLENMMQQWAIREKRAGGILHR